MRRALHGRELSRERIPRGLAPVSCPTSSSAGAPAEPVIVYLHGGGWVVGTLDTPDALCRRLATRSGCRVLSVDYRLAPEHPFPAAYDDALAIIRWLEQSPKELGQPVSGVALAGDSAGGAIALAAALESSGERLGALLLLYPVTDISRSHPSYGLFAETAFLLADDMRYFAESYAPSGGLRRDPRVSPLLASDVSRLPPTTLLTCGFDVLRDEGRAWVRAWSRPASSCRLPRGIRAHPWHRRYCGRRFPPRRPRSTVRSMPSSASSDKRLRSVGHSLERRNPGRLPRRGRDRRGRAPIQRIARGKIPERGRDLAGDSRAGWLEMLLACDTTAPVRKLCALSVGELGRIGCSSPLAETAGPILALRGTPETLWILPRAIHHRSTPLR